MLAVIGVDAVEVIEAKLRGTACRGGSWRVALQAEVPDGAHHLFGRVARPFIRQLLPVYRKLQRTRQKTTGHGG